MDILIADEDIVVRKKIRSLLETLGHRVLDEAQNGLHVYHKYVEKCPDLLMMNLNMSLYDGLSTVKRIRGFDEKAKIIVMMEERDNQKIFEAIENGAVHYLVYPLQEEDVLKVLYDIKKITE